MEPIRLVEHLNDSIPSQLLAPEQSPKFKLNLSRLWGAMLIDWGLAWFISATALLGYHDFLNDHVMVFLASAARKPFMSDLSGLAVLLTPIIYFAITAAPLMWGGQTVGLRIFGMRVVPNNWTKQESNSSLLLDLPAALWWATGTTVSIVTAGFLPLWRPEDKELFIEQLSQSLVLENKALYWHFAGKNQSPEAHELSIRLVDNLAKAQENSETIEISMDEAA